MNQRAFSALEVKGVDDERRTIIGLATSPVPDRSNDVVEPMGAKFAESIPLFLYHDSRLTVGSVKLGRPTKEGIPFVATIPKVLEPGALQQRVDEAWQLVKYKLIAAVSIGFRAIEGKVEHLKTGGLRFIESEILELSLVPVPMQSLATIHTIKSFDAGARKELGITAIKSIDEQQRAALGREQLPGERRDATPPPGASGTRQQPASGGFSFSRKDTIVKTITEQIAALEAARAAKAARMSEIMQKSMEEGRSTDEAESQEFDNMQREVKRADEDLVRLRELERMNAVTAKAVQTDPVEQARAAVEGRQPYIVVQRNLPKGTGFTRYIMALARAKGNVFEAAEYAKQWKDTPEVTRVLKAAVDAGTTTDADWAAKLVDYTNLASEFVELLRPMTILGKFGTNGIPALRRVPFNVRMTTQTAGGTYGWVGEGSAKPVGELVIGEITLKWAKAAGIIVVTDELMRFSSPSVEAIVRADMLAGMAAFSDSQFINPDVGEVANVSPASITNGVTPITASGTTAAALRDDITSLWDVFFAANQTVTTGVWIMSNRQAMRISLMRNALDQREFPDMTPLGGTFEGFPVIASEHVPDDSNGGTIVFANANDIFFSDDGPVTIDASREASLQMNSTPDNPTSASTVLVSLWQRNLIALRAERYMNWKKRRSTSVGFIQGTNYST